MKKLCAKQNRRAKQWEFFAISSQTVRNVLRISQCEKPQRISQCEISQCEKPQRISQCEKPHCEFGNAKNHSEFRNAKFRNAKKPQRISQCETGCEFGCKFGNANFRKGFAFLCETNEQCFVVGEFGNAKFAMRSWETTFRNAKWLPTDCQLFAKIHVLLFLF